MGDFDGSQPPKMYTAGFAFFEAIWEAGVTHCFVNLGSDHPSLMEAMIKAQREKKGQFPKIITCPNEVSLGLNMQLSGAPSTPVLTRSTRW
jgi:hypothetical protein